MTRPALISLATWTVASGLRPFEARNRYLRGELRTLRHRGRLRVVWHPDDGAPGVKPSPQAAQPARPRNQSGRSVERSRHRRPI